MNFNLTLQADVPQIAAWIEADPDHQNKMHPDWWLTGNDCVFAGRAEDDEGVVLYIRLDREGELARLHTQFGPVEEVSKKRTVKVLLEGFPQIIRGMQTEGFKGIVFESTSANLIKFMTSFGFSYRDCNDYVLSFKETQLVRT